MIALLKIILLCGATCPTDSSNYILPKPDVIDRTLFGSSITDLRNRFGNPDSSKRRGYFEGGMFYFQGIAFHINHDSIADNIIRIFSTKFITNRGVKVGDSKEKLISIYGEGWVVEYWNHEEINYPPGANKHIYISFEIFDNKIKTIVLYNQDAP